MSDRDYAMLCEKSYNGTPDYGTRDGPRAFCERIDGKLVICFPGSRSLQDWTLDFMAAPTVDMSVADVIDLGPVHLGFLNRAKSCRSLIYDKLKSTSDYVLIGHSLGGAIALLVGAMMLTQSQHPPDEIITFGAPRVGMITYSEAIRSIPIRQYRFGIDPIPEFPTWPFVHARPLIEIGQPIYTTDIMQNHAIVNYIDNL